MIQGGRHMQPMPLPFEGDTHRNAHKKDISPTQTLALAMIDYNNGDPKRIQHTTKVHAYASMIGRIEGLDEETLFILESAALVHDIGIRASEQKYGHQNGKLQEQVFVSVSLYIVSDFHLVNKASIVLFHLQS